MSEDHSYCVTNEAKIATLKWERDRCRARAAALAAELEAMRHACETAEADRAAAVDRANALAGALALAEVAARNLAEALAVATGLEPCQVNLSEIEKMGLDQSPAETRAQLCRAVALSQEREERAEAAEADRDAWKERCKLAWLAFRALRFYVLDTGHRTSCQKIVAIKAGRVGAAPACDCGYEAALSALADEPPEVER